jgi:hypothetical protein
MLLTLRSKGGVRQTKNTLRKRLHQRKMLALRFDQKATRSERRKPHLMSKKCSVAREAAAAAVVPTQQRLAPTCPLHLPRHPRPPVAQRTCPRPSFRFP